MRKAAKDQDQTEIVEIDDLTGFLKAVEGFAGRSSIFRGLGDSREEHTTLKRSYENSSRTVRALPWSLIESKT